MKKPLLVSLLVLFAFVSTAHAQQFYINTNYYTHYQAGLDSAGIPIITFDDVLVDSAFLSNTDSLSVNKVVYGVYRGPHAPKVTVNAYYSILDDTTTVYTDNLLAIPPVMIGSMVLDSNRTNKTIIQEVSFGDSLNPIFKTKNTVSKLVPASHVFFLGLSFSKPNDKNAWLVTSATQSDNVYAYFWQYDPGDTSDTKRSAYVFADGDATFYLKVYGKPGTTTLPVTLNNFDGVIKDGAALLSWNTSNEQNNKGFEVQRSLDGQSFSSIGFVAGQNLPQNNHYSFIDNKIVSGANFYRLKQIDMDGREKLYAAIRLDYSQFAWSILGNPSSNNWLQLQLDKTSNVLVQVLSLNGNVLQQINKGSLSRGTYSIPLNLQHAAQATYIVKLTVGNQTFTKKIVH